MRKTMCILANVALPEFEQKHRKERTDERSLAEIPSSLQRYNKTLFVLVDIVGCIDKGNDCPVESESLLYKFVTS